MRYCGRDSQQHGIERIDQLLQQPRIHRARLSRELCERLNWRRANGRLKDMSCRVALLRMQADGLIRLPPPRNVKPVAFKVHPEIEHAVSEPTRTPRIDLARIDLEPIVKKPDSLLWNAYLERYH
ncbi:MAG TPA: hypothetical protein ENH11_02845 [Candidatus Acetothermia bacterium]|nr:hypothetical protein [Candidatus Acetothermia bacterium]